MLRDLYHSDLDVKLMKGKVALNCAKVLRRVFKSAANRHTYRLKGTCGSDLIFLVQGRNIGQIDRHISSGQRLSLSMLMSLCSTICLGRTPWQILDSEWKIGSLL